MFCPQVSTFVPAANLINAVLATFLTSNCNFLVYRDNVEDALEKLQAAVDGAVESIQPIEIDPEKQKQMNKQ